MLEGIMRSAAGKFHFKAAAGFAMRHQTVTLTLREQDGKRSLKGTSDDGLTQWRLTPVKRWPVQRCNGMQR